MVYLQTILIGVVIVGLGALLLYIFKIRQLYIVVPTLYGYSDLTSKGKVFEVKLYNKSLQMEEDIQVTMPSDFSYSIIATDNNAVKLESNLIHLSRLGAGESVSVLLLAEGGDNQTLLSHHVSSKTTTGKFVENINLLPGNFGKQFVSLIVMLLFLGGLSFAFDKCLEYTSAKSRAMRANIVDSYSDISSYGWKGLEFYIDSDIASSYSKSELPIHYNSMSVKDAVYTLNFTATNKTAIPFSIGAFVASTDDTVKFESISTESYNITALDPMQSKQIILKIKVQNAADAKTMHILFNISYGRRKDVYLDFYPPSATLRSSNPELNKQ